MATRPLPNDEKLLIDYLRGHAGVTDELGADRVSSRLPAEVNLEGGGFVTLFRVGGVPIIREHLDNPRVQVNVWAATQAAAKRGAQVVRAALMDAIGVHDEGVVTDVADALGLTWDPDELVEPPRPRYRFDVTVVCHPNPAA